MAEPTENAAATKGWLNRTVFGIGLASLFSDISHEIATVLMPKLLAGFGAASAWLGIIEGVADGLSSFAKLFAGWYTDRLRRRKPLTAAGYFITAVSMASFSLATSWFHLLIARSIGWLGRSVRSPSRNVLLTDAATPETRGRVFGFERMMDSLGAMLAPLLVWLLLHYLTVRQLLALTIIPGVAASLCILFFVRENPRPPRPHPIFTESLRALPPNFRRFTIGVGLAGLGDFANSLLILWAVQALTPLVGEGRAMTAGVAYYAAYNLAYTVFCYVSGWLADRFTRKWVLVAGYLIAVIPAIALIVPGDPWWRFGVVFVFSGVYMGMWETVESAEASTLLPAEHRGTGFGVLSTVSGIGDLVSSAVVGVLWAWSPVAAMSFVVATTLAGAAVVATVPASET